MRGVRGLLTGALALIALHTLVATGASGRVAGLLAVPGQVAVRFLDPTVAAIPDRRGGEEQGATTSAVAPAARRFPDPFSTGAPGGD